MKYMGSKARLSKNLLPIILSERKPEQFYVEPFAGGMNMICNVTGNRIANDNNMYLIEMWKALLNGWIPTKITKEFYNHVRYNKEESPLHLVGWVGFNCSYSGRWFEGFAGDTITSDGSLRDYQTEAIKNINKQVPLLDGVVFNSSEYYALDIPDKSIIYCDPPYAGTKKYHSAFDSDKFFSWAREMCQQGHSVYVSEYNAPKDFVCVYEQEVKSSLSANGVTGGSKSSVERLFKCII